MELKETLAFHYFSKVPAGGDALLPQGVDHPGGGLGAAAWLSERDAASAQVAAPSRHALPAPPALPTHEIASILGSW